MKGFFSLIIVSCFSVHWCMRACLCTWLLCLLLKQLSCSCTCDMYNFTCSWFLSTVELHQLSHLPSRYLDAALLPPQNSTYYLTVGIAQIDNRSWNFTDVLLHSLLNICSCWHNCLSFFPRKLGSFDWNPSANAVQELLAVKQETKCASCICLLAFEAKRWRPILSM